MWLSTRELGLSSREMLRSTRERSSTRWVGSIPDDPRDREEQPGSRGRLRRRAPRAFASAPLAMGWCVGRYLSHRWSMAARLGAHGLDTLLQRLEGGAAPSWLAPVSPSQYVDAVQTAEAILEALPRRSRPPATCLYRSLARYALGSELGMRPTFVIGVSPDAATASREPIGHAWVEIQGRPTPPETLPPHVVSYTRPARPS
ncbi:MAG: lasso peptide biosynthesis B2 protein [Sandaracinaceae bacterium]|nr:lasso peptide biosynthesis B2 protein [Sandaracinaceae bacterium]